MSWKLLRSKFVKKTLRNKEAQEGRYGAQLAGEHCQDDMLYEVEAHLAERTPAVAVGSSMQAPWNGLLELWQNLDSPA